MSLPSDITTLYDTHFDFVWRVCRRLGVAPTSIEDAVQDVFLVAHRRLADFRGDSSPRTWLFAISRRVAKDYRRRSARKDRCESLPATLRDVGARSPADQIEERQALAVLDQVLASLDEDKREVLVLAEILELSGAELAKALGVKLNTAYSRLRLARLALADAVAKLCQRGEERP